MAKDAPESPGPFARYVSSFLPSTFRHFKRKSELLSYLILCVAKMPFIPPVSIARSVSGLAGKERPVGGPPAAAAPRVLKEDKGGSVKERLASNLKQLGKKSQARSRLPTPKETAGGSEVNAKRRGRAVASSAATESFTASSSGESLSKQGGSLRSEPDPQSRAPRAEEAHFTLTLTPEAVLLLQRRNSERRQRSASRSAAGGGSGGLPASASDSRRRRDNGSKRQQSAIQRHGPAGGRAAGRSSREGELGDISSIVKISLLNERHKYDDVEYEEEQDSGVDERVVLKCTEWLRGLENAPVTVGNGLQAV